MEQEQMQLDFYAMLQEKKKEESKKAEPKPTKTVKAAEKKTASTKKEEKVKEDKPRYDYPFSLYTEGRTVDISNYGFENGKLYTEKEITEIMLKHRHYEFSGEMTYSMIEEDNTLVATAKQYKKG